MIIRYVERPDLPPLSWLAVVSMPARQITVLKGRYVQAGKDFFVEGVWDGDFSDGRFDETDVFFGSGMRLAADKIIFVPSCATVDALHYRQEGGRLLVSNSLPFLLAACRDRLDPQYRAYAAINDSIKKGIEEFERDVPTVKGAVRRIIHHNLVLTEDHVSEVEKPLPSPFSNFNAYRDYLRQGLLKVLENARSPHRRESLKVISTQSRGYDSTAINSLLPASEIDAVFTIPSPRNLECYSRRDMVESGDDSGEDICKLLGLPYSFLDKHAAVEDAESEALCFSTVHVGADSNLWGLVQNCDQPSVLLTGVHGDVVWATDRSHYGKGKYIDGTLRRGDLSLAAFTEVRLSAGLIQVGVPFMGARAHESVSRICNSEDMRPWRLGNSYDRPIPRRIAEEAGIPRDMFGQKKMATALVYGWPPIPWNRQLRVEFFRFLRENKLASAMTLRFMTLWVRFNEAVQFRSPRRYRVLHNLERLIGKISRRPYRLPYLLTGLNGSLFCYCVNLRIAAYALVVEHSGILTTPYPQSGVAEGEAEVSRRSR